MIITSITPLRTFTVSVPDFGTRVDEEDGIERDWLTSEVQASGERSAIRAACDEWAEMWPSMAWPKTVELLVLKTHYPDGSPTGLTAPNRVRVGIE